MFKLALQAFVLALLMFSQLARADYPDRPIRIIVPFPPGGGTDGVSRLIACWRRPKIDPLHAVMPVQN